MANQDYSPSKKRVYLIPSPDMKQRAIDLMRLDNHEIIALTLPQIDENSTLQNIAVHLRNQIEDQSPFLLGVCFGSVLALVLAKEIPAKKIVTVSSPRCSQDIPKLHKIAGYAFLLAPTWPIALAGRSLNYTLKKILKTQIHIPRIWLKAKQNKFIVRCLLCPSMTSETFSAHHIHGDKDWLFPLIKKEGVTFIHGGGHFLMTEKPKSLLKAIDKAFMEATF